MAPPTEGLCTAIFEDFLQNYRRLETWHIRQRRKILAAQYESKHNKVFEVVKKEAKGGISYLETTHECTIFGS